MEQIRNYGGILLNQIDTIGRVCIGDWIKWENEGLTRSESSNEKEKGALAGKDPDNVVTL